MNFGKNFCVNIGVAKMYELIQERNIDKKESKTSTKSIIICPHYRAYQNKERLETTCNHPKPPEAT